MQASGQSGYSAERHSTELLYLRGRAELVLYLVHRINAVSSLGVNVYNILVTISCDTELVVLERRFC
jgi:hypothetical protein